MICPECHGAVDENAAVCSHCGVTLAPPLQCGQCLNLNIPGSKYCDQCGTPLEQSPDQRDHTLRSERKHVTVMFSDISRYREIINRVDPEEIRDVTRHLFEATGENHFPLRGVCGPHPLGRGPGGVRHAGDP